MMVITLTFLSDNAKLPHVKITVEGEADSDSQHTKVI